MNKVTEKEAEAISASHRLANELHQIACAVYGWEYGSGNTYHVPFLIYEILKMRRRSEQLEAVQRILGASTHL